MNQKLSIENPMLRNGVQMGMHTATKKKNRKTKLINGVEYLLFREDVTPSSETASHDHFKKIYDLLENSQTLEEKIQQTEDVLTSLFSEGVSLLEGHSCTQSTNHLLTNMDPLALLDEMEKSKDPEVKKVYAELKTITLLSQGLEQKKAEMQEFETSIKEATKNRDLGQNFIYENRIDFIRKVGYDYGKYRLQLTEEDRDRLFPHYKQAFDEEYAYAIEKHKGILVKCNPYIKKHVHVRKNAFIRGRLFHESLTPEIIELTYKASAGFCPVSGVKMPIQASDPGFEDRGLRWSVERLNNQLGYYEHNIALVAERVNKARGRLTYREIVARAAGVIQDESLTLNEWGRLAEVVLPAAGATDASIQKTITMLMPLRPGVTGQLGIECAEAMAFVRRISQYPEAAENWVKPPLIMRLCEEELSGLSACAAKAFVAEFCAQIKKAIKDDCRQTINLAHLWNHPRGRLFSELMASMGRQLEGENICGDTSLVDIAKAATGSGGGYFGLGKQVAIS